MRKVFSFLIVVFIYGIGNAFAQCGTETFDVTDWCENQYAEWEITNPDPDARYHWYEPVYNAAGTAIIDTIDRHYGEKPDGSHFASPYRYTTPDPVPAGYTDERTFWYVKEKPNEFGPAIPATDIGNQGATAGYSVSFTSTQTTRFHTVSVPIHSYYVDPNQTFHIQVNIGTYYSNIITFRGTDLVKTGNTYFVRVPVNLTIPAGTYTMGVVTNPANPPAGTTAITNLSWFNAGQFTFPINDIDGINITGSSTNANNQQAMIFDWETTTYCDHTFAPVASKTTVGCCTPVINTTLISSTDDIVTSGSTTLDLTVATTAADPVNNYFVWYKDGTIIGTPTQGQTTITVNSPGTYAVREVGTLADVDNISCYSSDNFTVQERVLFAVNNTVKPSYCIGDIIELEATGDVIDLAWSPAGYFSAPTSKTTTFTPTVAASNVTLTVTANVVQGNLITNGDFEAGNTGFISNMTNTAGTPSSNNYRIDTYVTEQQAYWNAAEPASPANQCRHEGNFMYADGFNNYTGDPVIWEQSVTVSQNQLYVFSMEHANISWNGTPYDVARVADTDATFDVYINNINVATFTTNGSGENAGVCRWVTDTVTWNSLNSNQARIQIKQKTQGGQGYDFAIDNIQFGGPKVQTAKIDIGPITDCYAVIAEKTECQGDSVILTGKAINSATGEQIGIIDRWEANGTVVGNGPEISVKPTSTTSYIAYGYFPAKSLIENGNYEFGLNGFQYGSLNGLYDNANPVNPGTFGVITTGQVLCNGFCVNPGDHSDGTGDMLFIDPKATDGNVIAYTFEAEAGKDYLLNLWIANAVLDGNEQKIYEPTVRFLIDGPSAANVEVASITLPRGDNTWKELSSAWTAPANGTYTLNIWAKGDNSYPGLSNGNDFIIDDIMLATALDNVYTDTIEVDPCRTCIPGKIDSDQDICYNTTPLAFSSELDPELGAAPYTFEWQSSTDLTTWTPIASSNSLVYTPATPLTEDTYFRRKETSASCPEEYSDTVKVTVFPEIIAGAISAHQIICEGTAPAPITGTAGTGGDESFTYQWQTSPDGISFTNIPAATNVDLSPGILTDTTFFRRLDSSAGCPGDTSNIVKITTEPNMPVSVTVNQPASICAGEIVTFNATPENGGTPAYKWFINDMEQSGETAASFSSSTLTNNDEVKVQLTSSITCTTGNPAEATAAMTVSTVVEPAVGISVTPDSVICEGTSVTFEVSSTNAGGDAPTFQWHQNSSPVPGETGVTFTPTALSDNDQFYVVMTSNSSCADPNTATSNIKTIRIQTPPGIANIQETDVSLCVAEMVLNADAPSNGTGTWSVRSGDNASFSPSVTANPVTVQNIQPGKTIMVYWTVSSGDKCPVEVDSVSIERKGNLTTPNAGSTQTVCITQTSVQLAGNPPATGETGTWTSIAPATVSASGLASGFTLGENSFVYTLDNGVCSATDTVKVITEDVPSTADIVESGTISTCIGEVTLNSVAPAKGSGTWSLRTGDAGSFSPDALTSPVTVQGLLPSSTVLVYWTVKNGNSCPVSKDSVYIERKGSLTTPAGNDEAICFGQTSIQLTGNTPATGETSSWGSIAPATINASGLASNLSTGENRFLYTLDNGSCSATDTVLVVVNDVPGQTGPITGPSGTLCAGTESLSYSFSTPGQYAQTYEWSVASGMGITIQAPASGANVSSVNVDLAESATDGVIQVIAKNNCGNSLPQTLSIDVTPLIKPTVSISADKTTFCPDSIVNFSVANFGSEITTPQFEWFVVRNGIHSSSGSTNSLILTDPIDNDSVYIRLTSDYGCPGTPGYVDSDIIKLSLLDPSATIISANGFTECEGRTLQLSVQESHAIYAWEKDGVAFGVTQSVNVVEPGNYSVDITAVSGGTSCPASDVREVTFLAAPKPFILQPDTVFCEGETYVLNATTEGGPLQWYKEASLLAGQTGNSYTVITSGNYYIVEDNGFCTGNSDTIQVKVENIPVANAGPDQYIVGGGSTTLDGDASIDGYNFAWSSPTYSGPITPANNSIAVVTPQESVTSFVLTVSSESGKCIATDETTVFIEFPVMPWNSFSPNGDGNHDVWKIENIEGFGNALVEVYNRWGNLVWSSQGYDNSSKAWRGESNSGGQLPVATYYYVIHPNGGVISNPLTGHVTIVR